MKQKLLFIIITVCCFNFISSQELFDCEKETKSAYQYLKGSEKVEVDTQKGITLLTQFANEGCLLAQSRLGDVYRIGRYINFDAQKAFYFTQMAAKQGDSTAVEKLSRMCEEGIICSDSTDEILAYHKQRFSKYNCADKTKRHATIITGSERVKANVAIGLSLLMDEANAGCLDAQLRLGKLFTEAKDVRPDAEKATYYLKLAKEQGSEEAFTRLSKLCGSEMGCTLTSDERETLYEDKLRLLPCEEKVAKAEKFLKGSTKIARDTDRGLRLLNQYAEDDCSEAHFILGMLYKKGYSAIEIQPDPDKAFFHLNAAVELGHVRAVAHLGQLYERGFGCKLDYDTAKTHYLQNISLGDDMGAYCMGYSHMKGLGSVVQDYQTAISWFEQSEYAMAVHWLAVLHYFGFGTAKNQDLAIEMLVNNDKIRRSPLLIEHFMAHKDDTETILGDFKSVDIAQQTQEINEILETHDEQWTTYEYDADNEITPEKLTGNWVGKLVELDWSGTQIMRQFPVELNFSEGTLDDVNFEGSIANEAKTGAGFILDNSLYFDYLEIALPSIFRQDVDNEQIVLKLLAADLELKTIDHIEYITAFVDSNVLSINEPGQPMLLVLANTSVLTDNGIEISNELIEALISEQGENFISLYPNPFHTDLLIQYELETETTSAVEMYDLSGTFYTKIVEAQMEAGDKIFYYDGSHLPSDQYYVVKVTAGNKVYTKLIIKQ